MDTYPPAKQREALLPLLEALDASPSTLRRDDCGDPRIDGRWGHIYAVPGSLDRPNVPGFQIVVLSEKPETGAYDRWTAHGWNVARKAIEEFAEPTNDGTFFSTACRRKPRPRPSVATAASERGRPTRRRTSPSFVLGGKRSRRLTAQKRPTSPQEGQ
jgi:hypothetical protein